jgi:hypothetical protein
MVVGASSPKNKQKEIFTFSKECVTNLKGKYFEKIEFNTGIGRTNFYFLVIF